MHGGTISYTNTKRMRCHVIVTSWIQCQEWDLPGKTMRAVKRDTLPTIRNNVTYDVLLFSWWEVDSGSRILGLSWDGRHWLGRLSNSNNNNRFVAMVTSLNSVARMLAIVVELFVGLFVTIAGARCIKPWLRRLLCGRSKRINRQNIMLILGLKGSKTSLFSNQLIYSSIKRVIDA